VSIARASSKARDADVSSRLHTRKNKLRDDIEEFNDQIQARFDCELGNSENIGLASHMVHAEVCPGTESFRKYAKYELEMRVGAGHDTLNKLRTGVGLGTYLGRHHRKKQVDGQKDVVRMSSTRARANENIRNCVAEYRNTWKHIQGLMVYLGTSCDDAGHILKGLQPLNDGDTRFLTEWVDDNKNYIPNRKRDLPWIWKVAMLDPGKGSKGSEVSETIEGWEREGMLLHIIDTGRLCMQQGDWNGCIHSATWSDGRKSQCY
jgi:hypothetical protein